MTTMRSPLRFAALAGIACALAGTTGCAGLQLFDWNQGDGFLTADAQNPVQQIVCIWEPSEGHDMDGLPARGFAGQILFFTAGSPMPVKVNGDVRIYEYDNLGSPEEQGKPIHQFDFLGDAWTAHFRPHPSLGAAYQVFVPYVRKGPWQAHCAMRVRFTPEGGRPLFSDLVHVTLPGPHSPTGAVERANPLAKFRNKPNATEVELGATLDHKRLSVPEREAEQEIARATERDDRPQMQEFDLRGRRIVSRSRKRSDVEANRDVALGDAEIERLVREYHQARAGVSRQETSRTSADNAVRHAAHGMPADSASSTPAPSTGGASRRRYRLTPATMDEKDVGTRSAVEEADEFEALFSEFGRTSHAGEPAHPLSDLAPEN